MVEVPGWAVATGVVTILGLFLALSVVLGLYIGEKRSSATLENVATYGRPNRPPKAEVHDKAHPEEEKVQEIEEQAVDRLANDLQKRAKRLDKNMTDEEARQEAERLLRRGFAKAGGATR